MHITLYNAKCNVNNNCNVQDDDINKCTQKSIMQNAIIKQMQYAK